MSKKKGIAFAVLSAFLLASFFLFRSFSGSSSPENQDAPESSPESRSDGTKASSHSGDPAFFADRTEAYRYVTNRIRHFSDPDSGMHAYAGSWTRNHQPKGKNEESYMLMGDPEREFQLAESFRQVGLFREARFHYRKTIELEKSSRRVANARDRLNRLRTRGVFDQVPPSTVLFHAEDEEAENEDDEGDDKNQSNETEGSAESKHPGRYLLAYSSKPFKLERLYQEFRDQTEKRDLASKILRNIHRPALQPKAPNADKLSPVSFVGRQGFFFPVKEGSQEYSADRPHRFVFREAEMDVTNSGSEQHRTWYYVPLLDGSLQAAMERRKQNILDQIRKEFDSTLTSDGQLARKLARAYLYVGDRETAKKLLNKHDVTIPHPLEGSVDQIAGDPSSPYRTDAIWRTKTRSNPSLEIKTDSMVTTDEVLPVDVRVENLNKLTFSFYPVEKNLPDREKKLSEFLDNQREKGRDGTPEYKETVKLQKNETTIDLPVRNLGTYRVVAEGRHVEATFIASRTNISGEVFALPEQTAITLSDTGFSISSGDHEIRETGNLRLTTTSNLEERVVGRWKNYICEEHKDCCAGCQNCFHHGTHEDLRKKHSRKYIFASGNGQFFRAAADVSTPKISKDEASDNGPRLLVYTDRPVYKAGDRVRFRGILRKPKDRMGPDASRRWKPGSGEEVSVRITNGDSEVYAKKFVAGEYGTFHGAHQLALSARRATHKLIISYGGQTHTETFEVMDYRKRNYVINMDPVKDGFRVRGGYRWGEPVEGAHLEARVNDQKVEVQDGFVPASGGQRVEVELIRDGEVLASKQKKFTLPVAEESSEEENEESDNETPDEGRDTEANKSVADQTDRKKQEKDTEDDPEQMRESPNGEPVLTIAPDSPSYGYGETIRLNVKSRKVSTGSVTVVLGDQWIYDLKKAKLENGKAVVTFPAEPVLDPGVSAWVIGDDTRGSTSFAVRTAKLPVRIDAPEQGNPGETIPVRLKSRPDVEFSLAAVDEAIYMLGEDKTPSLYRYFYRDRPAAMNHQELTITGYDGEKHVDEPRMARFAVAGPVNEMHGRLYMKATIGLGGGAGGTFGAGRGGSEDLGKRGGAGRTSNNVMDGLMELVKSQDDDGFWRGRLQTKRGTINDVGSTSLALLALSGAGYTHLSNEVHEGINFGQVVKKGLFWLIERMKDDGSIAGNNTSPVLNQALAARALMEAYGLTGTDSLKKPAMTALQRLTANQSENGGWHPESPQRRGKIVPSVFSVLALETAQKAGLQVSERVLKQATSFFDEHVGRNGFSSFPPSPLTVAAGTAGLSRLTESTADARIQRGAGWLFANTPGKEATDVMAWCLSTRLFAGGRAAADSWQDWTMKIKKNLLELDAERFAGKDHQVPALAFRTLTMQMYYRYENVFASGSFGGILVKEPREQAEVRTYFPDTAFWGPSIKTDENGEARISFRLPEQMTTTRLTARGINRAGAVGEEMERVSTQKPFFAKINAPKFFVRGDRAQVRVQVYNYTDKTRSATVRLNDKPPKTIEVSPGKPAVAKWEVTAGESKEKTLTVRAHSGDYSDGMEISVPINRVGYRETITRRKECNSGSGCTVQVPEDVERLRLRLHPKQSNLTRILDALGYLSKYPHG